MKFNKLIVKTIIEGYQKSLLSFNDEIEFKKSGLAASKLNLSSTLSDIALKNDVKKGDRVYYFDGQYIISPNIILDHIRDLIGYCIIGGKETKDGYPRFIYGTIEGTYNWDKVKRIIPTIKCHDSINDVDVFTADDDIDGFYNTEILFNYGSPVAEAVKASFKDCYIPTLYEMDLLYKNREGFNGMVSLPYPEKWAWTSNQRGPLHAYIYRLYDAGQMEKQSRIIYSPKNIKYPVVAFIHIKDKQIQYINK